MGLFDLFKGEKNGSRLTAHIVKMADPVQKEYTVLTQIADILSNGDADTINEIHNLVSEYQSFYYDHQEWCDEILDGIKDLHNRILAAFAYWMVGYNADKSFGGYIDWKTETQDILWNLRPAIKALQYPLDLNAINFSEDESTDKALEIIDTYFAAQEYVLVCLDTDSDCYHMFIVQENKYSSLVLLGETAGFKFFRPSA